MLKLQCWWWRNQIQNDSQICNVRIMSKFIDI